MTDTLLLGCIADDFTGASDLANTLANTPANTQAGAGMRTTQYIGVPNDNDKCQCEAAIIALKSRSIDAHDAVAQSLQALRWLHAQGARQFLFKYCSTFDSTPSGNIGPVAEALAAELNTEAVVVCPAFPTTGRTVFQGHLFVFDKLLNESGLENHPLNPMTDADLRRWLLPQCKTKVGHIAHDVVSAGAANIKTALADAAARKETLVVVDATDDQDLFAIGEACTDAKLITGGSGIALGLPENFRRQSLLGTHGNSFTPQSGDAVILCGSCSETTRQQIVAYKNGPHIELDVDTLLDKSLTTDSIITRLPADRTALIYSSAEPDAVKRLQIKYGTEEVAVAIESFFGELATKLVDAGVERLVVAGGETSGAIISALHLDAFDIGPEIDPGVPALSTISGDRTLAVALKSGNFGAEDFFERALHALAGKAP